MPCSTTSARGPTSIVPLANGEPVALLDAIERGRGRPRRRVGCTRCTRCATGRYLRGEFGDRLRHVSYFLSHVTRPHFRAGTIDLVPNNFSEMRAILSAATRDPLVVAAASAPTATATSRLGAERRLHVVVHRPGPLLPRGQPARCPGRSAATRSTVSQVVGWTSSGLPARRGAAAAVDRARPRASPPRRRADPRRRRSRPGSARSPTPILRALAGHRDLGVHTELLSDGVVDLVERGVVTGVAQAAQPDQDRRHVRPRHAAAVRLPRREPGVRAVAGPLRQRSAGDRPASANFVSINATARRRLARPVRVGDDRRRRTTRRAAARPTSPAARCTPRAGRGSWCCSRRPSGGRVEDRAAAGRRRRRDHAEEHRRQGRHRVGRRRAARPVDPGARRRRSIAVAHPDHREVLTAEGVGMGYL